MLPPGGTTKGKLTWPQSPALGSTAKDKNTFLKYISASSPSSPVHRITGQGLDKTGFSKRTAAKAGYILALEG